MENTAFRQLKEAIDKAKTIGIAVGKQPTLDEMGAALALYLSLSGMGKTTAVASVDEPIVELSSLVGINKVKPTLAGDAGDLTVSFPYKEGEIEKVSYTLENGYLNIVVKAGENGLTFNERDIKYSKSAGAPELLIIVGAPKISDLGHLFNPEDLKNSTIVNIDNKADNQGFGDIVLVSPRLSSVCEIAANLIFGLGLKTDRDIAQNLMIGLSYATEDFRNPRTSYLAFQMAGVLLQAGAARMQGVKREPERFSNEPNFIDQLKSRYPEQKDYQGTSEQGGAKEGDEPSFAKALRGLREEAKKAEVKKEETKKEEVKDENAPEDWLTPKIYKGSTNF